MTEEAARRESLLLEKRYRARFLRFAWPRLLCVLLPLYDPRAKRAPRGAAELLAQTRPERAPLLAGRLERLGRDVVRRSERLQVCDEDPHAVLAERTAIRGHALGAAVVN